MAHDQNQTHPFLVTISGCGYEQAQDVMATRLLQDDDEIRVQHEARFEPMPSHAGVCDVEDRVDVVLARSAAEAEQDADRRALLALAGTNWTEDSEDFTAAEMERTARSGTSAEVAALLQDASDQGAFEREDISWSTAEIAESVDTSQVLEPEPVSAVLERMIAAGTAAPAAREMPAGTVLRELMQANATDRVRATFEYGLVIEASPTMSGPYDDWTISVPNFGSLGGTADVLIATDASGSQVADALGWSTHLTDLQLLEPLDQDEEDGAMAQNDPGCERRFENLVESQGWDDAEVRMMAMDFIVERGLQRRWAEYAERVAEEKNTEAWMARMEAED